MLNLLAVFGIKAKTQPFKTVHLKCNTAIRFMRDLGLFYFVVFHIKIDENSCSN